MEPIPDFPLGAGFVETCKWAFKVKSAIDDLKREAADWREFARCAMLALLVSLVSIVCAIWWACGPSPALFVAIAVCFIFCFGCYTIMWVLRRNLTERAKRLERAVKRELLGGVTNLLESHIAPPVCQYVLQSTGFDPRGKWDQVFDLAKCAITILCFATVDPNGTMLSWRRFFEQAVATRKAYRLLQETIGSLDLRVLYGKATVSVDYFRVGWAVLRVQSIARKIYNFPLRFTRQVRRITHQRVPECGEDWESSNETSEIQTVRDHNWLLVIISQIAVAATAYCWYKRRTTTPVADTATMRSKASKITKPEAKRNSHWDIYEDDNGNLIMRIDQDVVVLGDEINNEMYTYLAQEEGIGSDDVKAAVARVRASHKTSRGRRWKGVLQTAKAPSQLASVRELACEGVSQEALAIAASLRERGKTSTVELEAKNHGDGINPAKTGLVKVVCRKDAFERSVHGIVLSGHVFFPAHVTLGVDTDMMAETKVAERVAQRDFIITSVHGHGERTIKGADVMYLGNDICATRATFNWPSCSYPLSEKMPPTNAVLSMVKFDAKGTPTVDSCTVTGTTNIQVYGQGMTFIKHDVPTVAGDCGLPLFVRCADHWEVAGWHMYGIKNEPSLAKVLTSGALRSLQKNIRPQAKVTTPAQPKGEPKN